MLYPDCWTCVCVLGVELWSTSNKQASQDCVLAQSGQISLYLTRAGDTPRHPDNSPQALNRQLSNQKRPARGTDPGEPMAPKGNGRPIRGTEGPFKCRKYLELQRFPLRLELSGHMELLRNFHPSSVKLYPIQIMGRESMNSQAGESLG